MASLLPRILSSALEARFAEPGRHWERVDEKRRKDRTDEGEHGKGNTGRSGQRSRGDKQELDDRRHGDVRPSLSELVRRCWSQWSEQDEALLRRTCAPLAAAKDPAAALRHRQEGNRFFQQKQNGRAAACYSRSICMATPGSEEQALAFANRSAALFHLQHHEACLDDIARALAGGYPARLAHKLRSRRTDAEAALEAARLNPGDDSAAATAAAVGNLDISGTGGCGRAETLGENGGDAGERREDARERVSVELRWSERSGRHLVAARDLRPGETLLVEPAFASAVAPDADAEPGGALPPEERCCHHCLREAEPLPPVPCQLCGYARFCGEPCRDAAWRRRRHGATECALARRGLLQALGPFVQASLRAVLAAGPRDVAAAVSEDAAGGDEETARSCDDILRGEAERAGESAPGSVAAATPGAEKTPAVAASAAAVKIPGCGDDAVYRSDYRAVYHLVTHAEARDAAHILPLAWAATAVCRHLREVGFSFPSGEPGAAPSPRSAPGELRGELLLVGTLLLRHLLQLWCNAYAVTTLSGGAVFPGTRGAAAAVESSERRRVAVALFPVASLLNHACRPNVSLAFRGDVISVRAAGPIAAGDQLLHCYGPQAGRMSREERRRLLRSQYRFECECAACAEEEQEGGRAPPHDSFLCQSCGSFLKAVGAGAPLEEMECSSARCGRRWPRAPLLASHAELRAMIAGASDAFERRGKLEVACEVLAECLRRGRGLLGPLHATLGEASDCLAQVLAVQGRWEDAARHLRDSLASVEARFGPDGPETAYELFKLTQLLFNGRQVAEALEVLERAAALLSLHFGEDHPPVQELHEMRRCLVAFRSRSSAS